jgi:hypothetical protein
MTYAAHAKLLERRLHERSAFAFPPGRRRDRQIQDFSFWRNNANE